MHEDSLDRPTATLDQESEPAADTLSGVLRSIRISGGMFLRVRLRAPYGVTSSSVEDLIRSFAPGAPRLLPFHIVTRGPVWFETEGARPVCLDAGDVIVLPRGNIHHLVDRPGRDPIPADDLQHAWEGYPPTLVWGGGGPQIEAMCGFFQTEGRLFNPLVEALPEVLVVRREGDGPSWLASTLERAYAETSARRPGSDALMSRMTELLFIDVIQRHFEQVRREGASDASNWFVALTDPVVGDALAQIHREPGRDWSLQGLATSVGASRSALAERFTGVVGMSPMRYLASWRMELAGQRMLGTPEAIGEIALAVGYESEAAFNRAFKRHAGEPPAAWRRRHRPQGALA